MNEELTPRQQILLWDLVSRGGSALQKDLKPAVTPADHGPLKKRGFISISKEKQANRLTLEEGGWNHVATRPLNLSKSVGSKYDRLILQFVLNRIQSFATCRNVAIASIFAGRGDATIAERDGPDAPAETKVPDAERAATEQDIRAAFFEIAGRPPRDGVRLSALRAKLGHVDRATLDATMLDMRKAGTANLMNLDNPRDIEPEKEAALQSGFQTFHVLWIDE